MRQHSLHLLRGDIFALVVDDKVFLAVRDLDTSLLVYHADVAGVEPIIGQYAIGFPLIAPIAFHHQFTADQYLAIIGDAHLCVLERRADRVHFQPRPWPVATYDWPSLGLAIALAQRQPERMEEEMGRAACRERVCQDG